MRDVTPGCTNNFGNGFFLRAHRLYVEIEAEMGMIDLLDDINRLGRGLDEVGFDGAEWLERQSDAASGRVIETGRENFLCMRHGLFTSDSRHQVSLLGR